MGIRTVEVTEVICDACGKVAFDPDAEGYGVYGVSGTVSVTSAAGGFPASFFSCEESAGHIGKAVVNAIARERAK